MDLKMASGWFALLEEIEELMDKVVLMIKIAPKKTAGILGDNLEVNAKKASGLLSSREFPVYGRLPKVLLLINWF